MLAYDYPLLDVFVSMTFFFLFVIWIFLLFKVITDLFRDHEQSGLAKAVWVVFLILLPYIGVVAYIFAHGREMSLRSFEFEQHRSMQLPRLTDGHRRRGDLVPRGRLGGRGRELVANLVRGERHQRPRRRAVQVAFDLLADDERALVAGIEAVAGHQASPGIELRRGLGEQGSEVGDERVLVGVEPGVHDDVVAGLEHLMGELLAVP